jgi:hypothetical protein
MESEPLVTVVAGVDEIQEHEWFDDLAEISWAHEAGDGTVGCAARPMDDAAPAPDRVLV